MSRHISPLFILAVSYEIISFTFSQQALIIEFISYGLGDDVINVGTYYTIEH